MLKTTISISLIYFLSSIVWANLQVQPKVVYGEDNRIEIYQVERSDIREIADSTVALVKKANLSQKDNQVTLIGKKVGEAFGLCVDEPFREQPTSAFCSGFLVGDDLIATAGHCINQQTCQDIAFVFGFEMQNAITPIRTVDVSEVYYCQSVVKSEYTSQQDYSLVKVDRPVRGHRPLKLSSGSAQKDQSVFVIGHPSGIPKKVADDAQVRKQYGAYFSTNLDTYGGNSGSPVFDSATLEVLGILVRGENDYDHTRGCGHSKVCEMSSCRGEDVTNISYISEALKQ